MIYDKEKRTKGYFVSFIACYLHMNLPQKPKKGWNVSHSPHMISRRQMFSLTPWDLCAGNSRIIWLQGGLGRRRWRHNRGSLPTSAAKALQNEMALNEKRHRTQRGADCKALRERKKYPFILRRHLSSLDVIWTWLISAPISEKYIKKFAEISVLNEMR